MIVLYILAALAALFILFFVLPAVLLSVKFFSAQSPIPADEYNYEKSDLAPHAKEYRAAVEENKKEKFEEVSLTATDGIALYGKILKRGSKNVTVFVHGYRVEPETVFALQINEFLKEDTDILYIYQRAHKPYPGDRCTLGIKESSDVLKWAEHARGLYSGKVILYGVSMGAATLCYASDRLGSLCDLIVADCGFTCPGYVMLNALERRHIPDLFLYPIARLFLRGFAGIDINEDVRTNLSNSTVPVLFIHGMEDKTVKPDRSELCCSATPKGELILVEGAAHAASFGFEKEKIMKKIREMSQIDNTQEN